MDVPSIGAAIASVKALKDILQSAATLTIDSAIVDRINEARHRVADALSALLDAQEERIRLLNENQELLGQIRSHEDWEKKKAGYQLQQTAGGAVVYASVATSPTHYACPSCIERHEIQILQDIGGSSFECPGCKVYYSIKPMRTRIKVESNFDPRDF